MAADRSAILLWVSDLAALIVTDAEDAADLAIRITDADGLSPADFAGEILSVVRVVAESVSTSAQFDAIDVTPDASGETLQAMSILTAMALSISAARIDWPSRPAARRARTRISIRGDEALSSISAMGAGGVELWGWMSSLVAVSSRLISDIAANAAPIVRIRTGISLPSCVLAHQLYGDANRADSLVEISGSTTPLVMPTLFDALAV